MIVSSDVVLDCWRGTNYPGQRASKACVRRAHHIRVQLLHVNIARERLLSISPLVERLKLSRENISYHDIY